MHGGAPLFCAFSRAFHAASGSLEERVIVPVARPPSFGRPRLVRDQSSARCSAAGPRPRETDVEKSIGGFSRKDAAEGSAAFLARRIFADFALVLFRAPRPDDADFLMMHSAKMTNSNLDFDEYPNATSRGSPA
jgi:hypothetical protein